MSVLRRCAVKVKDDDIEIASGSSASLIKCSLNSAVTETRAPPSSRFVSCTREILRVAALSGEAVHSTTRGSLAGGDDADDRSGRSVIGDAVTEELGDDDDDRKLGRRSTSRWGLFF